ncbi:membrane protein of unknown function [Bradyrhizobium sp. ORS 285]|uniref:hypothetical protein n=1 Tax=Bradyrhizobium sp. ORS 285 TaxID=115808 RepID=UPI000240A672|nr:hypothetical protein [Bradyrhizobium sp. ORS 285]CCD89339.1 membrane hypothetical protein [Bradyrhizobium sp. ORS 285]SMX58590.1 membrane protein of unknown function [Bradyrhizobium sp. ORS 285]
MKALLSIVAIPIMLLNAFGGIVSGIWLAILGQWWAIGYGIAGLFVSTTLLGFAMMPGLIFAAPAAMLAERGKLLLAFPLLLLSQLYTYIVVIAWCVLVFIFFMSHSTASLFWPLLIWSYGAALGPLMYMAHREEMAGDHSGAWMTTAFAQLSYIVMAVTAAFTDAALFILAAIFGVLMLLGMLIQTGAAIVMVMEQKRLEMI